MSKPGAPSPSDSEAPTRTHVARHASSAATTPEEIPPIHVLEAAHDQERREAEELLAGFDRPGRSPRRRTAGSRDFVDHYAGREVTRTPAPGAVSGKMVIRPVQAVRVPNHFRTRVAIVLATTLAIVLGMGAYVWVKTPTQARELGASTGAAAGTSASEPTSIAPVTENTTTSTPPGPPATTSPIMTTSPATTTAATPPTAPAAKPARSSPTTAASPGPATAATSDFARSL